MQETQKMWVQFLDQEEPLKKEMATHSSILAWRIPWTVGYSPWGHKELDMSERLSTHKITWSLVYSLFKFPYLSQKYLL